MWRRTAEARSRRRRLLVRGLRRAVVRRAWRATISPSSACRCLACWLSCAARGVGVMSRITGRTVVAGVIGWPVAHSLSPPLHNAWIDAAGLDGVYVAFASAGGRVRALRRGAAGGRRPGAQRHRAVQGAGARAGRPRQRRGRARRGGQHAGVRGGRRDCRRQHRWRRPARRLRRAGPGLRRRRPAGRRSRRGRRGAGRGGRAARRRRPASARRSTARPSAARSARARLWRRAPLFDWGIARRRSRTPAR